jgi:hypothetical protein
MVIKGAELGGHDIHDVLYAVNHSLSYNKIHGKRPFINWMSVENPNVNPLSVTDRASLFKPGIPEVPASYISKDKLADNLRRGQLAWEQNRRNAPNWEQIVRETKRLSEAHLQYLIGQGKLG